MTILFFVKKMLYIITSSPFSQKLSFESASARRKPEITGSKKQKFNENIDSVKKQLILYVIMWRQLRLNKAKSTTSTNDNNYFI